MYYIGIAAYSGDVGEKHKEKIAKLLSSIKSLCGNNIVIVVGGYEGLMRYVVDTSLSIGFRVVILPPIEYENGEFPKHAIVIKTGTTFTIRSLFIVRTSHILIAVGGGAGTLHEIFAAYNERKPIYILTDTGLPTDVLKNFPDKIDYRVLNSMKKYSDSEELARDLCTELDKLMR